MSGVYLDTESDKVAVVMRNTGAGEPVRVATVYLMSDGWHAKSADLHTRHAWTGPYVSAAEALASFATPAVA
jgi:hypothetical protein